MSMKPSSSYGLKMRSRLPAYSRSSELVAEVKKEIAPLKGTKAHKDIMALCAIHEERTEECLRMEDTIHGLAKRAEGK